MNEAIARMLEAYTCRTREDYTNAVREIFQSLALFGLWRAKFFEHAAFYGGTALRILHGLDRYSEDMDFSLLKTDATFSLPSYGEALRRELASFGFEVEFESRRKVVESRIDSAFLKANTLRQLMVIKPGADVLADQRGREQLKIKLEIDTDPPGGFQTVSLPVLVPVPFAVRVYSLPDLFAGKMHAILCRSWQNRVKGRDWYDLVWYLGHHPEINLAHLEQRMRQSGNWTSGSALRREDLLRMLDQKIDLLDTGQARDEVARFVRDRASLELWSRDFFRQIVARIKTI
jgi:predicted nucleotidyltransferase component of viral defense system